jgi:hypothetical protein
MEYTVYGRTETSQGRLVGLAGNTTTFTDDGSGAIGDPAPAFNELSTQYVKLSNMQISANYSTRAR